MKVRNRFKGLDLIDRVPDELWTEVRDIVQETGIKTIPMAKTLPIFSLSIETAIPSLELPKPALCSLDMRRNSLFQSILLVLDFPGGLPM